MSEGTRVKARWVPELPSPEAVDKMVEETGLIPDETDIHNFNLVSVSPKEKKKADSKTITLVVSAILPITTVNVLAGILVFFPFAFAILTVASIAWIALLMALNIKR